MPDAASPAPAPAATRVRLALRWRDMDMLGHLNQSVYHELLEEGRAALLTSLDGENAFAFVLARVELDHVREVRADAGHVDVDVRVAAVGRSSFTVEHEVLLPDGTVAARGRSVLVAWDPAARAARELTAGERHALGFPG
jgi:acyl-CoA thioester hydrolase